MPDAAVAFPPGLGSAPAPAPPARLSVLVVDDEVAMRNVIKEALVMDGPFTVSTAPDGASALQTIDEIRPDILLIDMLMPIFDGFTVLEKMQTGACQHRPERVVAMSGLTDPATVATIIELGADSVLPKPFTLSELRSACEGPQ